MSVFDRLTNTASSTPATSVYNRLVGTKATTTPQGSVYDRLTKPVIKEPVKAVLPPVKEPFSSTGLGIATNTILGIPKAVYKSAKYISDNLTDAGKALLSKKSWQEGLKGFQDYTTVSSSGHQILKPEVAFTNLIGGGGVPGRIASGISPKVLTLLKGTEDVAKVEKTLGEVSGLTTESIKKIAPIIAKETNPKTIESVIKSEIQTVLKQPKVQTGIVPEKLPTTPATLPEKSMPAVAKEVPAISQKPVAKGAVSQIESKSLPHTITEPNISQDVQSYIDKQVASQVAARDAGVVKGVKNTAVNVYKEAKRKLVDFAAPIEDALRVGAKKAKVSILPSGDITNQIDRVLKSPTMAGKFAEEHGITQVIKDAPNLEHLDQYMIAKQAIAVDTRGINTGRDMVMDNNVVKALRDQYEPFAAKVTQYSRDLLNYAVDAGLVSKDTAEMLFKRYPDYVPLNRIFSETEKGNQVFGSRAVASLGKQTVVQSLKGSDRAIEGPVQSILERTIDAFKQAERNKAARMLASYEKIPGNPLQLRELAKGETAGKNTITFFDNGVKRTFETTKEIADAARNLNSQQLNILGKIFALPVRLAKIGITGINLPFVASNIARDQVTAIINSKNALRTSIANPAVFLKSLWEAVGHGKVYDEMVRNGALGTSFDLARSEVGPTIAKIRSTRTLGGRIKYTVRHPGELLRAVENIIGRSEELTRIQQYSGTKQAALKTMDEASAQLVASRAARENTVNFARRGEWGQVLNSAFLYLNAGIQGSRTFVRSMRTRPVQTATKLALVVFTPVAAATAWNLSDPKRKEAYDDILEYEKQSNIIIIPPNPTKNADGTWNVIKIPLSQEVNNLAGMIRRPIEAAHGLDPVSVGDVASALIGSVSPVAPNTNSILSTAVPQAIKPSIESAVNRNIFTGVPIVPESMTKLSPELQYKPYTSGTARLFGKATGMSPLKIEAFIKGTVGGVGSQAINVIDNVMATGGVIPKDQIGGQNVIRAISARFASARGGQSEQLGEELLKTLTAQSDTQFLQKQDAEIVYTAMKSLPKEEAAAKFNELVKSSPAIAKQVASIAQDDKLGLSYADRMVKTLQVNNGNRAKFIAKELNALKTMEEKKALWNEYLTKKIITAQVAQQITSLLKK